MLTLGLALAACVGWGAADFLGGLKSRSLPTLTVLIFSNIAGLAVVTAIIGGSGRVMPRDPALLWAPAAGLLAAATMFMLYRGLATGCMAIVSPISATGVIIPILFGLGRGETLSYFQAIGISAAFVGTVLAARERARPDQNGRLAAGVGLAIGAAFATGAFFVVIDQASAVDPYWATLFMRLGFAAALMLLFVWHRPALHIGRPHLLGIISLGTIDSLASFSFVLATTMGMLSIVSVVSSLFPLVTVMLSAVVLHERPAGVQALGVMLALAGVGFISAG